MTPDPPPTSNPAVLHQQVMDVLPERLFWKDRQGRYLGCNLAFARDAGRADSAAVVGLTDADLMWSAQAEAMAADETRVLHGTGGTLSVERRIKVANGDDNQARECRERTLEDIHNFVGTGADCL